MRFWFLPDPWKEVRAGERGSRSAAGWCVASSVGRAPLACTACTAWRQACCRDLSLLAAGRVCVQCSAGCMEGECRPDGTCKQCKSKFGLVNGRCKAVSRVWSAACVALHGSLHTVSLPM